MATRLYPELLITACLSAASLPVFALPQDSVIQPDVERRTISEAHIDSENIEIGLFVGQLSIEDFSNSPVYGLTLDYHISENWFAELTYGQADAGLTSYEVLSGGSPILTDEQRQYRYYDASFGYNLNGEIFVTQGLAFNSDLYLLAGAGSTDFAGDNHFTINLGAGYRLLLTDFFALRLDVRDHIFSTELIGSKKDTHNIQYSLGASFFF